MPAIPFHALFGVYIAVKGHRTIGLGDRSMILSGQEQGMPVELQKPRTQAGSDFLTLNDSELSDLIDCVTIAADRAESSAYDVAGTPKAKKLALSRAKRLYALANR